MVEAPAATAATAGVVATKGRRRARGRDGGRGGLAVGTEAAVVGACAGWRRRLRRHHRRRRWRADRRRSLGKVGPAAIRSSVSRSMTCQLGAYCVFDELIAAHSSPAWRRGCGSRVRLGGIDSNERMSSPTATSARTNRVESSSLARECNRQRLARRSGRGAGGASGCGGAGMLQYSTTSASRPGLLRRIPYLRSHAAFGNPVML